MILHADLDAFYASVAQRDDPSLRGKPVAVSGSSRRAVVLTASYEARPYGVRSAMPLFMAKERCPHLVVVPPDFDRYRAASAAVFDVYRGHARAVEALSLDEAFLDLGPVALDEAVSIARRLKAQVRERTALAVSVGVAAGMMVAKIACDDGKPDGLVAVQPGTERAYLAPKPVGALVGIGPKTQIRLRERGIERIEQIASMGDADLQATFGRWGAALRDLACGIDGREVNAAHTLRSISTETTLEHDVSDIRAMLPIVRDQARELSDRLRDRALCAYTIAVKIKLSDFTITGRQTTLKQPTDDARVIGGAAAFCLRRSGVDGRGVRLLGVRVGSLVRRAAKQTSFFSEQA